MDNAAELWKQYRRAITVGDTKLAEKIFRMLKGYSNPPQRGGCAKCRKRMV